MYFCPYIEANIEEYIKTCVKYQMNKHRSQPKIGKLLPLPIPKMSFQLVLMDYMICFPKAGNWNAIMVVICRFCKWTVFLPTNKNAIANEVAKLFFDNWARDKVFPYDIVSNFGLSF